MIKMHALIKRLEEIFYPEKPWARLLSTESGYYLYDTGTNKILNCTAPVYSLISNLFNQGIKEAINDFIAVYGESEFLNAAEEITGAVETEKILSAFSASSPGMSGHLKDIPSLLQNSVRAINLEVTQDCNLRCVYCIYQDHFTEKRNYSKKWMSLDIARAAIDMLKRHSSGEEEISIGFYGGEPLLRFPFIKECVGYARSLFDGQKINFNITTNGTLIDDEIAGFLIKEGFFIMVSLDGPKEYHDQFRQDQKGKGSFVQTQAGLKRLSQKYELYKTGTLAINAVFTPPYTREKMETLNDFFASLDFLPGNIRIFSRYPTAHSLPARYFSSYQDFEERVMTKWAVEKYKKEFQESPPLTRMQTEERFAKLIQRPILNEVTASYPFNGCCVPGIRRNYITVDGDIHICEKIPSNAPKCGNVTTGFDYAAIKKHYVDDYIQKSIDTCARCWCLRLCDVCYIYAFNDQGEFDLKKKNYHCQTVMQSVEHSLCQFISILEENPGKLDYLYDFDIM